MNSKLGIIAIEWQSDAVKWAIQNKPTAFEFMITQPLDPRPMYDIGVGTKVSQIEAVKILAENSPKTLLIIRAYPDDYDHPDFQERMLKWSEPFKKVSDRVVTHSINEPVVFNSDMAKKLNDYEIGFIERMSAEGLIPMCFCLSESHLAGPTIKKNARGNETGEILDWGNLPLWQYMIDGVEFLAEEGGFLGLNEYDWPNWNSSRTWGCKWRLGHWEVNFDFIKKWASVNPQVGIGEGVIDGKIWTSRLPKDDFRYNKPWGYRKVKDGWAYLADIGNIQVDSYNRSEVIFHLLFAWAPGHPHWDSYDISTMQGVLSEYLRQNPPIYWESNGGNNMKNPIKVGIRQDYRIWNSPIVQVKEMEMEEYLRYCIPYEVYASWNFQALRAQAVAARTFATWMKAHGQHPGCDVCNSACCQVMGPRTDLRTDRAVEDTEGMLIKYQGEPIKAEYFSFCGGRTEDGGLPYQKSVSCQCWEVAPKDTVKAKHNRGMCQWGAEEMARRGKTCQEILNHYYSLGEPAPDWEGKYRKLKGAVIEETTARTGDIDLLDEIAEKIHDLRIEMEISITELEDIIKE